MLYKLFHMVMDEKSAARFSRFGRSFVIYGININIKFLSIFLLVLIFTSCQDDGHVFEKSADERATEAIASLKEKLVAPSNGWIIKYRPEQASGSFNVLLKFDENNNVNIKTDYGVNEGEFYDQTVTYRIDNSLGLELIFETYSFFSYLFEQEEATFGAEYEFNYINETNGSLVFRSKTDPSSPTTIIFLPASAEAENLLGTQLVNNLNVLSANLPAFTSVFKLSYTNKDLDFYLSFDDFRRTINFSYAAPKSSTAGGQKVTFSTGYIIQGDSMVFDTPLTGNFMGYEVSISSIKFNQLTDATIDACTESININKYTGTIAGSNDPVTLETTLFDPNGSDFLGTLNFYFSPLVYIYQNGVAAGAQIAENVNGAQDMQLYYYQDPNDPFLVMGFRVANASGTTTWALKEFTITSVGNKVQFEFAPTYTLYGDSTATIDEEKMNFYLNALTEGGNTYIFKGSDAANYDYEFYNPCNGWSYRFVAGN